MDPQTLLMHSYFDLVEHWRWLNAEGADGGIFDKTTGLRRFGEGLDLVEVAGFGVDRRGTITLRTPHGSRKALHIGIDSDGGLPTWLDTGAGIPDPLQFVLDLGALPDGEHTLDIVRDRYARRWLDLSGAQ
ncbi:hypothetical protein [Nocardioides sp. Leaf285]|uniref:hypothetical protein n=1 Tax=Nocardioides sp. Leaf285 TaxID=1736322 RepID=UPI000702F94A|nr:hypothetical protein [Nocardioides sp. Leaf285]KQP63068.1 hypothetical protein ASF47_18835 [Nocardioides sp. Leaf285]